MGGHGARPTRGRDKSPYRISLQPPCTRLDGRIQEVVRTLLTSMSRVLVISGRAKGSVSARRCTRRNGRGPDRRERLHKAFLLAVVDQVTAPAEPVNASFPILDTRPCTVTNRSRCIRLGTETPRSGAGTAREPCVRRHRLDRRQVRAFRYVIENSSRAALILGPPKP